MASNPTALARAIKVCQYAGIAVCVANIIEDVYQLTKDGDIVKHTVNIAIVSSATAIGAIFGPVGFLVGSLIGTLIKKLINW